MASIVSLVRVYLTATHYFATADGVVSGGIPYDGKLADHPRISRRLSGPYWGVHQADDVDIEIVNVDETLSTAFRAEEVRGKRVEIDRLDESDSSITSRFIGEVTQVEFSSSGSIRLNAAAQAFSFLEDSYPRVKVDDTVFSTATTKELDLDKTVPVCFGASREHVPARFVKDDQANDIYLYAAMHLPDIVNPRILTVYRDGGVVPLGEWELDTTTFPNYLCIKFTRRQVLNGLQSITFDYDLTELKNDANTVGLWYFQNNDLGEGLEDKSSNYNRLVTNKYQSLWKFDSDETDELGNNTLTTGGGTPPTYVTGRDGRKAARFNGGYFTITDASQSGLDPGAGSFRIEALIKYDMTPDQESPERALVEKQGGGTLNTGYVFGFTNGALFARIVDNDSPKNSAEVFGGTKLLFGVWQHVALEVDRTGNTMKVFLNGAEDASVSISNVTLDITNVYDFYVGGWVYPSFWGDADYVGFLTNNTPLTAVAYATGKTVAASALDQSTNSFAPYITDTAQTGLEFADAQDFTLEAWINPASTGTGTQRILDKRKGSGAGYQLMLNGSGYLVGFFEDTALNDATLTGSTDLRDDNWHHVAVTYDDSANAQLYVDGAAEGSAASVTALGSLAGARTLTFGAQNTAGSTFPFDGLIDEVRISNTLRTAAEIRAAYYLGLQSPVRQARYLLESTAYGASQTVDSTTWDSAEATVAGVQSGALKTALALVEPRTLGQYLSDLLRVRGMRLGTNTSGNVTITVDTQQSVVATVGYKDGYWDNIHKRPVYENARLADAIKTARYLYRRGRDGAGDVKAFMLKTSARTVLTVGKENAEIALPAVRDRTAADLVAYYDARRQALADEEIRFRVGPDLLTASLGGLLTFYDPTVYGSGSTTLEIRALTEQGDRFNAKCTSWNSDIYTYTAGTLPSEPTDEATPDYSNTPPDAVTSLSATGGAGKIDLTWTNPSVNFAYVVVEYKFTSNSGYNQAAQTSGASYTIDGLSAGAYDVRVTSWNSFSLGGGSATDTATVT